MTVPPSPEVRVGRDVLGQLVVGSYNVVVNAAEGSSVTIRAAGPPPAQRRGRVRSPPLRPGPEPLGRDRELAQLTRWLDGGVPVQVCGDRGIGKTTVLRHVVSRRTRTTDVLYLSAAGLAIDDLLQDVFEASYESEGYKPEFGQLRRLMTPVQALLVLDDFEASADGLRVLLDVLPACDLLFARTDRCLWAEGETLPLAGLPLEASIALLGKLLGRPLRQDELPDAIRLWQRTAGRPLSIIQSAAAFNVTQPGSPLAGEFRELTGAGLALAVAVQLSAAAKETLRVLGAVEGVPVPVQLLPLLTGQTDTSTALTELTDAGLIESSAGAVRLTEPFASHMAEVYTRPLSAATLTPALDAWAAAATPREVADAAPVVTSALDGAVREGNHAAACRLARTAAPRLALSLHWSAWSRVLALGRQAAEGNAPADEAYFDHEQRVLLRCLGLAAATGAAVGTAFAVGEHVGAAQAASPPAAGEHVGAAQAASPAAAGEHVGAAQAASPHAAGTAGKSGAAARNAHRVVRRSRGQRAIHAVSSHPAIASLAAAGVAAGVAGVAVAATLGAPSHPSNAARGQPAPSSQSAATPSSSIPPSSAAEGLGTACKLPLFYLGVVNVGSTSTKSYSFSSASCHTRLDTGNMSLKGPNPGAFLLTRTDCPAITTPGNTCTITVTFTPASGGGWSVMDVIIPEEGERASASILVAGFGFKPISLSFAAGSHLDHIGGSTMHEEPGDQYTIRIGGDASGQVVAGRNNTVSQFEAGSSARAHVTEDDLAQLRAEFEAVRALVQAEGGDKAEQAGERLDELEEAVTGPTPDLTTMAYVRSWFARNLPKLAGAITGLLIHPVVGQLADAAGDTIAAELRSLIG